LVDHFLLPFDEVLLLRDFDGFVFLLLDHVDVFFVLDFDHDFVVAHFAVEVVVVGFEVVQLLLGGLRLVFIGGDAGVLLLTEFHEHLLVFLEFLVFALEFGVHAVEVVVFVAVVTEVVVEH